MLSEPEQAPTHADDEPPPELARPRWSKPGFEEQPSFAELGYWTDPDDFHVR